ncbi:MAG: SGNH/GDSL hydrolase family protein, partial [Bacteroidia bacterium]
DIGYYDRLIEGDEDMTIGIGAKSFKKLVRKNPYTDAYYITNDIMHRRMKPNLKIDGIDHNFQSNSFGIRDKEYSVVKPPGTTRIALLGGSYEMGSGVDNDQVFEAIVEEKLNKERVGKDHGQIEIFNFAGGGYYLLQHVELANTTIFKYHPDGVIYFAHSDERGKVIKDFTNAIKLKLPLKYPFLEHIQEISGVKSYMSALQIKELLTPYADTIIKWGYHEIAERCKENNAVPIWAYLPTTTESVDVNEYNEIKSYAETLGFVTLDMRDAYGNVDRKLIQISEWNTHPNVLGHRLIATRFYRELLKNQSRIFLNNK